MFAGTSRRSNSSRIVSRIDSLVIEGSMETNLFSFSDATASLSYKKPSFAANC